jgi:hypothetical protein
MGNKPFPAPDGVNTTAPGQTCKRCGTALFFGKCNACRAARRRAAKNQPKRGSK